MVQRKGLIIKKFGVKNSNSMALTVEDLSKFKLSTDVYIMAANAIRDWAHFILLETSPNYINGRIEEAIIYIDETKKKVKKVEDVKVIELSDKNVKK